MKQILSVATALVLLVGMVALTQTNAVFAEDKTVNVDTAKPFNMKINHVDGSVNVNFKNSGSGGTPFDPTELQNKVAALESENDEQQAKIDQQGSTIAGLQSTVDSQQAKIDAQASQLTAAESQNAAQDSQIAQLNATLQNVVTGIEVNQSEGNGTVVVIPPVNNTGNTTTPGGNTTEPVVCGEGETNVNGTCITNPPPIDENTTIPIPPVNNTGNGTTGNGTVIIPPIVVDENGTVVTNTTTTTNTTTEDSGNGTSTSNSTSETVPTDFIGDLAHRLGL